MKYRIFLLSILFSFNMSFAEKVEIDLGNSQLTWLGKKLAGQHNGSIKFKSGFINITENKVENGEFILDMSSISNLDIESPAYKRKLEEHLKSDDFFNINKYPEGKFIIKGLKPNLIPSEESIVIGELTLKDQTHLVEFPVKIEKASNTYKGQGKVTIDRTKWDLKYNSDKFFDPAVLGDKLIYDDIEIELVVTTK